MAWMGATPMTAGSTPTCAHATMRARGATPRRCASPTLISTTAAAPSFTPARSSHTQPKSHLLNKTQLNTGINSNAEKVSQRKNFQTLKARNVKYNRNLTGSIAGGDGSGAVLEERRPELGEGVEGAAGARELIQPHFRHACAAATTRSLSRQGITKHHSPCGIQSLLHRYTSSEQMHKKQTIASLSLSLSLLILRPLSVLAQVGRFPHNLSLPSLPVFR